MWRFFDNFVKMFLLPKVICTCLQTIELLTKWCKFPLPTLTRFKIKLKKKPKDFFARQISSRPSSKGSGFLGSNEKFNIYCFVVCFRLFVFLIKCFFTEKEVVSHSPWWLIHNIIHLSSYFTHEKFSLLLPVPI